MPNKTEKSDPWDKVIEEIDYMHLRYKEGSSIYHAVRTVVAREFLDIVKFHRPQPKRAKGK